MIGQISARCSFEPASKVRTSSEPASVMEFGFNWLFGIERHRQLSHVCVTVLGRITVYVDAASCYRPSSMACRFVRHSSDPCKNGWTDRDAVLVFVLAWVQESMCYIGVHFVTTYRMRLNRPRAAAMRPFYQTILITCYKFKKSSIAASRGNNKYSRTV